MTNRKVKNFSPREKQAFCKIYNNKCAYCGELLKPYNLELDHIIPKSITSIKFDLIKGRFLLEENFNIFGYENILPACGACNKRKGNRTSNSTITYLESANRNLNKIKREVNKLNKELELDKHHKTTIPFELSFRDGIVKGPINKGKILELEERPIKFLNEYQEFLVLSKYSDSSNFETETIKVSNIREYREGINNGYWALSTYDMKTEYHFLEMNSILYALELVQLPKICYFSNSNFFLNNVGDIDTAILTHFNHRGYMPAYKERGKSLKSLIDKKRIKIIESNNHNRLRIEDKDGLCLIITELLRGDFSGEGYEQILCSVYQCYIGGGTLAVGYTLVLNKDSPEALAVPEYYSYGD